MHPRKHSQPQYNNYNQYPLPPPQQPRYQPQQYKPQQQQYQPQQYKPQQYKPPAQHQYHPAQQQQHPPQYMGHNTTTQQDRNNMNLINFQQEDEKVEESKVQSLDISNCNWYQPLLVTVKQLSVIMAGLIYIFM
eukprot:238966_1